MPAKRTVKSPTFEQGLERLESIANQMEKGDLPLDELLKLYEEGVKLSEDLTRKLDEMEGRMQEVQAGRGAVIETDVVKQESLLDGLNT